MKRILGPRVEARRSAKRKAREARELVGKRAEDAAGREALRKEEPVREEGEGGSEEALRARAATREIAQEDPLKRRGALLDKLAELDSGSVSGTPKFIAAREKLEEKLIVTKPKPEAAGMTPAEVEELANEQMEAEIKRRTEAAKAAGEEVIAEAAESEPVAEAPPLPESLSRRFGSELFKNALRLPEDKLLPEGRELKELEDEFSAALEYNIYRVLEERVRGGSLEGPRSPFPEAVVTTRDKLEWAGVRAGMQAKETKQASGTWSASLVLLKALERSGLTHEQALRTTVHAATNQAKLRAPTIFGIRLHEGGTGDPMDGIYVAINETRSGNPGQAAKAAAKLELLFTSKAQELGDVALLR